MYIYIWLYTEYMRIQELHMAKEGYVRFWGHSSPRMENELGARS